MLYLSAARAAPHCRPELVDPRLRCREIATQKAGGKGVAAAQPSYLLCRKSRLPHDLLLGVAPQGSLRS